MNIKQLTVMIGGREAIQVMAIPYATNWHSFDPEMLAWYLGKDDRRFDSKIAPLTPLTAYRMEGERPVAIKPSAWDNVADMLRHTDDKLPTAAASCLPAGAFVWLDEFQQVWLEWRERGSVPTFDEVPGFDEAWRKLDDRQREQVGEGGEGSPDAGTEAVHASDVPTDSGDELCLSPELDDATFAMLTEVLAKYSGKEVGASGTASESKHATGASDIDNSKAETRRKRSALIEEVQSFWPTVESDLRHSDENGLSAAKLPKHGYWDIDVALNWARENGKMQAANVINKLPDISAWGLGIANVTK